MVLTGKKVTLKPLESAFFQEYHVMFSPVVRNALGLVPTCSEQETLSFLNAAMHDEKHKMFYCVFDNQANKLIGSIVIRTNDHPNGQLGAWINENFWGAGRYQEALLLILNKYFESHDSIFAFVKIKNERSLRAHKKFEFEVVDKFVRDGYDYYKINLSKNVFEERAI